MRTDLASTPTIGLMVIADGLAGNGAAGNGLAAAAVQGRSPCGLAPGADRAVAAVQLLDAASPETTSNQSTAEPSSSENFQLSARFDDDSRSLPNAPSALAGSSPHGDLYGYFGSTLTTPAAMPSAVLPLSQFGGELGGSFEHHRSSYFVSYDQLAINRRQLLSNLAARVGIGNTGLLADANQLLSSAFAARVDHQFSSRDTGYLRYTRDQMKGNSLAAGSDTMLPASTTGLNTTQQSLTAANTLDVSPNTVNKTSGQLVSTSVELPADAKTFDIQSSLPSRRVLHVLQAADNVYRQVGGESLRLGGDFLMSQMSLTFLENSMGRAGNPSISQSSRDTGIYIQQARQIRSNLLVTTGARYDAQIIPGLNKDLNNFSPQLGIAWSPNSSRTVLRGGFGIDYDRMPLPTFAGSIDPEAPVNLSRSAYFTNAGPRSLGSFASFITVPPTIQNSYAEHTNFEVEQQLPSRTVLTAQYQFVRGVQLAIPVNRTVSLCAATNACNAGNEFTGQQIGTGATSTYNGVTVALTQTPVHWGSYNVSYTYSGAQDTGNGMNMATIEDAMHRLSFTGVLHTSLDAGSTFWQRLSHGLVFSGSADYFNREEFAGLDFVNVDARLTKDLMVGPRFRLQAVVQTFNMIARTNDTFAQAVAALDTNAATLFKTYTRVADAQSPDNTEGGLRLTF